MSGYLEHGQWRDGWYDTRATKGEFVRTTSAFRHWITADGSSAFPAERDRYHLYVSLACPWAHRFQYLHQIYTADDPDYTGRVLVPALWDKKAHRIVSNESGEILRMLNSAFGSLAKGDVDLYPAALREEIDRVNAFVYDNINNGVYRCGFATAQDAYERAFKRLFEALDRVEADLGERPYLAGEQPTEADWRLFTTLARFDAVYFGHFKCNRNRLEDFPNISRYLRRLYLVPGVAATVNIDHIKRHYYMSHPHINPTRIVPVGPRLKFCEPVS